VKVTSLSIVEVKKAWSCASTYPFSFMTCAGTGLPLLLPTVLYYFVCHRSL